MRKQLMHSLQKLVNKTHLALRALLGRRLRLEHSPLLGNSLRLGRRLALKAVLRKNRPEAEKSNIIKQFDCDNLSQST
jgi:hypothetical protein